MSVGDQFKVDVYTQYYNKVLCYVSSKVGNQTVAEDIAADVFLKVYENIDRYDNEKSSVSTWIYTITCNTLTDYYRTRHITHELPELIDERTSVEDSICTREMLDTLAEALEKLDQHERDVVILKYYSGKTLKEISQQTGLSYTWVKKLHNNALEKIKNFF